MTYEGELFDRMQRLEHRLENYHDALELALEHDRQFQLKATWGIVNALVGVGAVVALVWLVGKLGLEGWMAGLAVGVGWIFAYTAAFAWSDKGREGDLKKLSQLPDWERHGQREDLYIAQG